MSPHSTVSLCSRSLLFVLLPAEEDNGEGEGLVLTDKPRAAAGLRRFELASLLLLMVSESLSCQSLLLRCTGAP
jgi:hypothetical protein